MKEVYEIFKNALEDKKFETVEEYRKELELLADRIVESAGDVSRAMQDDPRFYLNEIDMEIKEIKEEE